MFVATCVTPLNFDMSTMCDDGLDAGRGKDSQSVAQNFIAHVRTPTDLSLQQLVAQRPSP